MSTGSFIPDKPIQGGRPVRRSKRIYLLSYAVYIFFAVAVLSTIAMWLYKEYLVNELVSIQQQVEAEQQRFDSDQFDELIRFDDKLEQATTVFYSQTDMAVLLGALEEVLLSSATLTSFNYDNELGQAVLTLTPQFQDINDALYQRDVINRHTLFSGAIIDDIVMNGGEEEGEATLASEMLIQYSITVQIDKTALRNYESVDSVFGAELPTADTPTSTADVVETPDNNVTE